MYQTEELIRSFDGDLNQINKHVIANIQDSVDAKNQILLWYADVIDHMQKENIIDDPGKHLQTTQHLVADLQAIHEDLIETDSVYLEVFNQAKTSIEAHIAFSQHTITSPVQICLNSVYGLLLLKLRGKQLDKKLQQDVEHQADILSYLSKIFQKRQKEAKTQS